MLAPLAPRLHVGGDRHRARRHPLEEPPLLGRAPLEQRAHRRRAHGGERRRPEPAAPAERSPELLERVRHAGELVRHPVALDDAHRARGGRRRAAVAVRVVGGEPVPAGGHPVHRLAAAERLAAHLHVGDGRGAHGRGGHQRLRGGVVEADLHVLLALGHHDHHAPAGAVEQRVAARRRVARRRRAPLAVEAHRLALHPDAVDGRRARPAAGPARGAHEERDARRGGRGGEGRGDDEADERGGPERADGADGRHGGLRPRMPAPPWGRSERAKVGRRPRHRNPGQMSLAARRGR